MCALRRGQSEGTLLAENRRMKKHLYYGAKLRQFYLRGKTNSPYLSGDVFASIVEYHPYGLSGTDAIDGVALAKARSLFVNSDRLVQFLEQHIDSISASILVTGNGDTNWTRLPTLPKSVRLWIAQNSFVEHPLSRTLPIGIENLSLGGRGLPKYFQPSSTKRIGGLVFVPPMSNTNPSRLSSVQEALKRPEIFDVKTDYLSTSQYFQLARRYRFVLCLEGNGADTHRVWETLYFGNFPVLLSTPWSRSLEYLGLPILLVEKLTDVSHELLEDFALRHQAFDPATAEPLWVPYWKAFINSHVTHPRS